MKINNFLLAIVLTIVSSSNCFSMVFMNGRCVSGGNFITPSGRIVKEVRRLDTDFNKIKLSGIGSLTIIQVTEDVEQHLVIEVDENLLPHVNPRVKKNCLDLGLKGGVCTQGHLVLNYILRVHNLNSVKLSGSGEIYFADVFNSKSLDIVLSGNGKVVLEDFNCSQLRAKVSGNGKIEIAKGAGELQKIKISGNGHFRGSGFIGKSGNIEVSGNGSADINIAEELTVSVRSGAEPSVRNHGSAVPKYEYLDGGSSVFMTGCSCVYVNGVRVEGAEAERVLGNSFGEFSQSFIHFG